MKKANVLFIILLFLSLSPIVKAQTNLTDYFTGKWSVLLKGTPNGDAKLIFVVEKKVDSLVGIILDSTGAQISKIDKAEVKDSTVTYYFNAQGYDVSLVLNRKDEDHVTGSLLNMFEAEGERVKAKK
ncbi:MAG: hypothetical protein JST09_09595 [Bacteroidetes bacterium]|nr:hypothetical protein [Bacteroidota bacterium]MBS1607822.1 hypothetical protein [Bacteroidota bacterium]